MIIINETDKLIDGKKETLLQQCVRACATAEALGRTVVMSYQNVKVRVLPNSHVSDIHLLTLCAVQLSMHGKKLNIGE